MSAARLAPEQSRIFSKHVRTLREAAGVRQRDFAPAAGVSQATLSRLESDGTTWRRENAVLAAAVFGTDPEGLLAGRGSASSCLLAAAPPGPYLDWHWSRVLAETVRSRRKAARLRQDSVARAAGVAVATLCGLELCSHRWRPAVADAVAAALGTDLAGLLSGAGGTP